MHSCIAWDFTLFLIAILQRERERERERMCVCERERDRERDVNTNMFVLNYFRVFTPCSLVGQYLYFD